MESILIVVADPLSREAFAAMLRDAGYEVNIAASGGEALGMLADGGYGIVLTELALPGMSGLDVLSQAKQLDPSNEVIVVTDNANSETAIQALRNGARGYLVKPVNHDELLHVIAGCREQRALLNENRELRRQVNLYRVSRDVANCLDLDCIGDVLVAALAGEAGVQRGLGFFLDEEGYLAPRGLKDLDETAGRALGELVVSAFKLADNDTSIIALTDFVPDDPQFDFAVKMGILDALVLAVRSEALLQGIVVLFNDPEKPLPASMPFENLNFLLEQSSRAFENASRYTTARNLLNIDELTGLFNYRYLETALDREIKRAERYRSSLSVVFLDLDQFKDVNDTHGHLVGSKVLREVGTLIKRLVREVDTVIRYGGDEYTIILVESTNVGAASVAERIRKAVASHTFLIKEGYEIRLTASLGYACYPDDSHSHTELLEMADQAMYRGKFSGKNVVFHIRQEAENRQGD